MPAARGVKRAASKSSASAASTGPKNKKKRGAIQLEIPSAPKKRGRVLTCGQGDVGQLGLGEDVIETTKFKYVTALGDKIVDVHAGGMHTIALDCNGKVWSFGCNDEGALGRAAAGEAEEGAPRPVALPARAVALAAGDSHSAALLLDGDVYAWGAFRDSHGSMGLVVRGREGKASREPVKVDVGEPAVAIASGGDHLVILSSSGSVYTMGCGEQGQLGRLSQRSASRDARQGFSALLVPSKVALKAGATRVWAGYHATFALDAHDKLLAWGLNNYGQLGITGEKRKTAVFSPTECDAFNKVSTSWQAVACGQHHSLAVDRAGRVYCIGRCEYGRLGLGDRVGDAEVPELVPKLSKAKCVSIAAGTSNSFAVTDTGAVWAWGMGSEGQLGTGQAADAPEPRAAVLPAAPGTTPSRVSAGGQHTVLLVEEPTSQKEASPVPEEEEQPMETEGEKETEQPRKRHKQEQDSDVSSTSSAQPVDAQEDSKPPKVNGDEKNETAMEVDDTDAEKPSEKNQTSDTDKSEAMDKMTDDDTEPSDPEKEAKLDTDTSSQGTDDKSQDTPDNQDKLNGETPETEVIEPKTLESIQQPLTTTA